MSGERDWSKRSTEDGGDGLPYNAKLLEHAYDPGVVPVFSDEARCVNLGHADNVVRAETAALRARVAELEGESERLRKERDSAQLLVAPALNYNGVPDAAMGAEWNAGYRQRQREGWSRALHLEQENPRLREALEWYADKDLYHCGMGDHDPLIDDDEGARARQALADASGEGASR